MSRRLGVTTLGLRALPRHTAEPRYPTSSMARISRRSLSITVMKSCERRSVRLNHDPSHPPKTTKAEPWQPPPAPYGNDIGDAAVEVALVVLDGDGPVLLDPLHGQGAVELRGDVAVNGTTGAPQNPGTWFTPAPRIPAAPRVPAAPRLTRNLRQKSSMELISEPCTCLRAALNWTRRREQAAVYLGRGRGSRQGRGREGTGLSPPAGTRQTLRGAPGAIALLGAGDLLVRRDAVLDVGFLQSLQRLHHRKELGHVVLPVTATGSAVNNGVPGGTAAEKRGPRWRMVSQEGP